MSQIRHCAVIPIICSLADSGWCIFGVGGEKVSKRENLMGGGAGHAAGTRTHGTHLGFSFCSTLCIQHDSLATLEPGQCVKLD